MIEMLEEIAALPQKTGVETVFSLFASLIVLLIAWWQGRRKALPRFRERKTAAGIRWEYLSRREMREIKRVLTSALEEARLTLRLSDEALIKAMEGLKAVRDRYQFELPEGISWADSPEAWREAIRERIVLFSELLARWDSGPKKCCLDFCPGEYREVLAALHFAVQEARVFLDLDGRQLQKAGEWIIGQVPELGELGPLVRKAVGRGKGYWRSRIGVVSGLLDGIGK